MATNKIVLDSGALTSLAQEEDSIRFAIKQAVADGGVVVLPTVALAESPIGNGSRDAKVNVAVKSCVLQDLDEKVARAAAALRFRRPKCGVADAIVVATADLAPGSIVLTGDKHDLQALAAVRGVTAVVAL